MIRSASGGALVMILILLCSCSTQLGFAHSPPSSGLMAITVDDIPRHGVMPRGETRLEISRGIVAALKARGVPAYGFVNGEHAEETPDNAAALHLWSDAFPVGNHTWSHASLDTVTTQQYRREIVRNEPLLERLSHGRDWGWFRYPYLAEGNDPAQRSAIREYLASSGYRIAAVTIDFSDFAYNDPYTRCVAKGDDKAIVALETEYLEAAHDAALASQEMARTLYGADMPQVLLTHVGVFEARMFPRLLDLYREMGFRFVTLAEAQNHPYYADDNDPGLRWAGWGLEASVRAKGLQPPAKRTPKLDLDTVCN
jgi:peptidoglycan/xylan/chitin deacetylase (PgdA/CDA1 family)